MFSTEKSISNISELETYFNKFRKHIIGIDQEFDSPKTLAAFALGLTLFVVTLCLNIAALKVVKKYRFL